MVVQTISKVEAARRQLDVAIQLYFQDGDEVAIHTLAAAAFELVTSLRVHAGEPDDLLEQIIPERRAEFLRMWRRPQNFFKHADRDPSASLEFDPGLTEVTLFLAVLRFGSLAKRTLPMVTLQVWFSMHNVDVLLDSEMRTVLGVAGQRWQGMSRPEFWNLTNRAGRDMPLFR